MFGVTRKATYRNLKIWRVEASSVRWSTNAKAEANTSILVQCRHLVMQRSAPIKSAIERASFSIRKTSIAASLQRVLPRERAIVRGTLEHLLMIVQQTARHQELVQLPHRHSHQGSVVYLLQMAKPSSRLQNSSVLVTPRTSSPRLACMSLALFGRETAVQGRLISLLALHFICHGSS